MARWLADDCKIIPSDMRHKLILMTNATDLLDNNSMAKADT